MSFVDGWHWKLPHYPCLYDAALAFRVIVACPIAWTFEAGIFHLWSIAEETN